ncbi:MAG: hypothetical protein HY326_11695 [Chloroflexi bacterium]|nr:hypothetical protein [Chloroflexota bacterium]
MFSPSFATKGISLIIALCCLVMLALTGSSASAAQSCQKISGKFTLQPVSGPACTSPVGICATGSYKGDVAGTSSFTGTSVIPTADTPTTAAVLLTGDNLFHTKGGDLLTKDAIVLRTTGAGEFAEVDTIVGGTGKWAGASGAFQATGTFTSAAGGEGEYRGEVCFP